MNQTSKKTQHIASGQKIVGNTFFSTLSELSLLMTSIFFILAARYLGDLDYGKFSAALGFVSLFSILILFGFTYSITKIIVRHRDRAGVYIGNALYIQIIFSVFCFGLCLGAAYLLRGRYSSEIRSLMAAVFVAETLRYYGLMLRASLKALGHFNYDTLAVNVERILLLLVGIPVLMLKSNIFLVAAVLAFTRIVSVIILLWGLHRTGHKILVRPELAICNELIRGSSIYALQSAFWRVYDHIDVVMLSLMRPLNEVGWYRAGRQILEGLWFIPNILTEVTYPELSARHLNSKERVFSLFNKAFKYMLVMGVMVTLGTVIIARPLVELIYGDSFEKTALILLILGITIIPSYLRYMFGNTLIAIDQQKKEISISVSRSFFNIAANLALIPFWGLYGATIATVATDYFAIIFYIKYLREEKLLCREQWLFIYKPFVAAAGCFLIYLGIQSLHGFIQFAVIIPAYILFLIMLRVFDVHELRLLQQVIVSKLPGNKSTLVEKKQD